MNKRRVGDIFSDKLIIPSVKKLKYLNEALKSSAPVLYLSNVHIGNLKSISETCHKKSKFVFVHTNLIGGFKADHTGIKLLKNFFRVDGLFSTNPQTISLAKKEGLYAVQRFFFMDSMSTDFALESLRSSNPDACELLPSPLALKVKKKIKSVNPDIPLLAAGYIDNRKFVEKIFEAGLDGLTTSSKDLWP
ncbi:MULTISPECIES: glycerol-3-phosphate responsive antiterminator [unclassified Halanaerobium]|uniref:glycerol-3-phosphate responsive antiterminator n=1 Tax=unclassified Halanaerobium TaxID=2641197 RepID=UPI000DF1D437|nr:MULTISPECIES: glycerol-3-phosphate responsive antiterminator [unclassified Halanaerobium]RCW47351.1 glycerol uptake operon antiterminator [Halanaerobium sp. MA284_MarDTE_T2]RCW84890.1 glycerol uptake operon antiterminator [Halanaerobium sp. DL-01]